MKAIQYCKTIFSKKTTYFPWAVLHLSLFVSVSVSCCLALCVIFTLLFLLQWTLSLSQPTPVGSVNVDSGASAITRESHANRDRPSQQQPLRNQVNTVVSLSSSLQLCLYLKMPIISRKYTKIHFINQQILIEHNEICFGATS